MLVNNIAMGRLGLGFDHRDDQITHTVANGSLPLRRFFAVRSFGAQVLSIKDGTAFRYSLRREDNAASIMKI